MDCVILWDLTGTDDDWLREVIALKKLASLGSCHLQILLGFDLLRDENRPLPGSHRVNRLPGGEIRCQKINLDEVCNFEETPLLLLRCKVVESEPVSFFPEIPANSDQFRVGIDVLQNLDHSTRWR